MDQSQPFSQAPNPRPKNWLVESILVTIFCCLPFGIVGIVFAASVNSKYDAGDYEGALTTSQQAGKWTKIGFWTGLAVIVLYFIFVFAIGLSFLPHRS
ncbi:CD225/dispanin family protein [Mucilaginibacter sp. X4EP1]|uniref:CD225/dispanin family protein n=1 Tax=Mucilaginibacter sp. X4EP1 TaxID=2723092 RepID=UPI00216A3892|nr:CD225/dispanin family protein [Mucilaginibacter sp. X4EP1]MCS3813944.1 heme/copper-type cytochrome/quinol oxidase subunit 2 [Mucilaginibacter sp. X4EP1]